jgi:putative ATPase
VERGNIRLIGATTENPSFEINGALLSRTRVYILKQLTEAQISSLLRRALADNERGLGSLHLRASEEVLQQIANYSSGDARVAYNILEVAAGTAGENGEITEQIIKDTLQKRVLLYDKAGEEHYNLISALHKSVRNSDVDASLYWLGRMLESGEDPLYVARRVVRMASEDIGLAAPEALGLCLAAKDAIDFLGMPEGALALAQAVAYLALAPKSNALYTAYGSVLEDVEKASAEPVPLHIRNAATKLMKQAGYGKGYQYAHDLESKVADMECMPDNLRGREYYHPTQEGREKLFAQRIEQIRGAKELARKANTDQQDSHKERKPRS